MATRGPGGGRGAGRPWRPMSGWLAVAALVTAIGVGLSAVGGAIARDADNRAADAATDRAAALLRRAVADEAQRYVDEVAATANALGAIEDLTLGRFLAATRSLPELGLTGAASAVYMVAATEAETSAVQARWRARGSPAILRPESGEREHLFAVLGRTLDPRRVSLVGLDLSATPEIRRLLDRTRDTGRVGISEGFLLPSDTALPPGQRQVGFGLAAPVYGTTAEGGRGPFRGWFGLGLRGQDFMAGALRVNSQGRMDVTLSAVTLTGTPEVFAAVASGGAAARDDRWHQAEVTVADKRWLLRTRADRAALTGAGADLAGIDRADTIVGAGGALSLLAGALVYVLGTVRRRLRLAVEVATADLARTETVAREQADLLNAVLVSVGDGVVVVDEYGRFLVHNPAGREIIGVPEDIGDPDRWPEHYGLYHLDGVTPMRPDELPLARALRGERCDRVEMVVRNEFRPTATWLSVSARPLELPSPVRAAVAVVRDITEAKRSEREIGALNARLRATNAELERRIRARTVELAEKAAALQAANDELEAFSYSVSHDLRAPLRSIGGFVSVVLSQYADQLPPAGLRYLDRVRAGAGEMEQLIEALLLFSRLQRQALAPGPVDLVRLVKAVWDDLAGERQGRQVELEIGRLPGCTGDARLLRQVLQNLLSNAVKYTRQRDRAHVTVGSESRDGQIVYFVRDNGVGFDMAYAGQLFTAFQRLHGRREYEGTGIGLALAYRIISRHGGRIWADAAPDQGATFYFTVPAAAGHGPRPAAEAAGGAPNGVTTGAPPAADYG